MAWLLGMSVLLGLGVLWFWARNSIMHWQKQAKDMMVALFQMQRSFIARDIHYEDSLTSLISWPVFQDRLLQQLKLCDRHQMTLGILYIDLDDFKVINDGLSFEVGNLLLKEVASRLQSCIRQVDSISRPDKDIFVVMLNRLTKPETAAIVAQRMLSALASPYLLEDHALNVSASIGISLYPQDGLDAVSLLQHAEQALRIAKSKGYLSYQFYQSKLHDDSKRELAIVNHLADEQLFNELQIYFQVVINAETGNMEAIEAELHWDHPALGFISQSELFSYAERQRRLNAITDWMLQKVCRQFLNWRALKFQPRLLAVPVLLKQFENTNFIYRLSQLLQQLHFNPSDLLLVVQQTGASVSLPKLEKAFNMLTYLGVKVAMDEQAESRFPLRYLKQFQCHYLRLEKTVTEDITTNVQTRALISSMLAMASNLGMQLIVSGVDTPEQKEKLKELGVVCMQGQAIGSTQSERELADSLTVP